MALRLKFEERPPETIVDWPLPGRAQFMYSEAFRILERGLVRYVEREVLGRSMLIAGHRGAGKTTLVLRAIAEYSEKILRDAVETAENRPTQLRGRRLSRPLLVKLYGPSLQAPGLPRPGASEQPKPADAKLTASEDGTNRDASATASKGTDEKSAEKPTPEAASGGLSQTPRQSAEVALVQIAIALYRALADEFAQTFLRQLQSERPELLEMAAQLRLDLDKGAEPAALRAYWDRARCLERGVLWPARVTSAAGLKDQGMHELIALVTAAQAYQVCAGVVKYAQTEKDLASYEATRDSKIGVDLKDIANRAAGLSVGGLIGWGLAQGAGAPPAAGAGIGAALLGSLMFTWSSRRNTKRERNVDYSFILDRSKETLDRDLPLVIERVHAAGLAPIFVVDELDKLDNPVDTVGTLIQQLKHLTTDYGFFCFLTDRDYYDAIQRRLEAEAYPKEHTYFSERLFILYRPEEFSRFVREVIVPDTQDGTTERQTDNFARAILGKLIVHNSKLNTVDAMRQLSRGWNDAGEYATASAELASAYRYRLRVTIQLAIEFLLRDPSLSRPIEQNATFAQLAIDALYLLSRRWEAEEPELLTGADDITAYLRARRTPHEKEPPPATPAPPGSAPDEGALAGLINPAELALIVGSIENLADLLCNFGRLRSILMAEGYLTADEQGLIEIIPNDPGAALLEETGSRQYRFLYDIHGRDLRTGRFADRAGSIPASTASEIERFDALVDDVQRTVNGLELDIDDFVSAGLLPSTVNWAGILQARERLLTARVIDRMTPEVGSDLPLLRAFEAAFQQRGAALTRVTKLVLQLHKDVPERSNREVLHILQQQLDLRAADSGTLDGFADADWLESTLPGPSAIHSYLAAIEQWQHSVAARINVPLADLPDAAWERWQPRLASFLAGNAAGGITLQYDDLVVAVAQRLPGTLLGRNLGDLEAGAWSTLCLLGARRMVQWTKSGPSNPYLPDAPAWTLIAGLRALRFDKGLLVRLIEEIARFGEPFNAAPLDQIVSGAPTAEPGVLVIVEDPAAQPLDISSSTPSITVRRDHLNEYQEALAWLYDRGVYVSVFNEGEDEGEADEEG